MTIHNARGFTLIEVMSAMAIFAIGILGVAQMQIQGIRANTTSRTMTEGATIAVNEVENLISYKYDDIIPSVISGLPTHVKDSSNVEYSITRTINDNTPTANIKQINITVTWSDKGKSKSILITTYKTK